MKTTIESMRAQHPVLLNFKSIALLFFLVTLSQTVSQDVRVYPLADDYFEKIYMVKLVDHQYYLNIQCRQPNMLSISLTPTLDFMEQPRFNIYGHTSNKPKMSRKIYTFLQQCDIVVDVGQEHLLELRRKVGETPFFVFDQPKFQYLHNSFKIIDHSTKWGLGQRFQHKFRVTDGKWTLWNRDKPWKIDRGANGVSDQTYGFQPIYLARNNQDKKHHLVYFKNTYGLLVEAKNDGNELTYHSVGGPIHFLIIKGEENGERVIEQYHDYIGHSLIPPFWSLGYHQCRWGYKTADKLIEVLTRFKENDLPIDVIWSDLDYMDRKMIFTVNSVTHGQKLNKLIKDHEVHFVPLLDAGVSIHDQNAMDLGKKLDVFFKDPKYSARYYQAQVWPGKVHFVDFLHPNAIDFWKQQMQRLYDQVQFSGIWIDMNEPSNFRGGQATKQTYRIQQTQSINTMTINVDLPHWTDLNQSLYHRQVHTYYGHLSTVAINQFLRDVGKRPLIISRSNSVGTGQFAGHWTGDNVATWDFLRSSINANFLFQIFGIQMVGSDICGFKSDTTEELCSRWYQLGAFYPFSRNHNIDEARDQQPYVLGPTLLSTSRQSLKLRYALLKYMYSVMVATKGRGSFFRPINFEFPLDQSVYQQQNIETSFLIGSALLVSPVVVEKQVQKKVYFPGEGQEWYQFKIDSKTGQVRPESIKNHHGKSQSVVRNQLPSAAPTFLRGGHALMLTEPANRSKDLKNRYKIFAALKNGEARVKIMAINDFEHEPHISLCISEGCFTEFVIKKIDQSNFSLSWSFSGNKQTLGSLSIDSVILVEGEKRWTYQSPFNVKTQFGQSSLQMLSL